MKGLWDAAARFARRVAPAVVGHELEGKGDVPLFIDATGSEVDGDLFERVRRLQRQPRALAACHVSRRAVVGGAAAAERRSDDAELAQAA